MPVKSTRFKTQTIFDGEITGLNEREKNVFRKAGIGGTPENVLVTPTGLTKTKLVGVGTNGQENIEIGDNLTLANGKLSATGGGGGGFNLYDCIFNLDEENANFETMVLTKVGLNKLNDMFVNGKLLGVNDGDPVLDASNSYFSYYRFLVRNSTHYIFAITCFQDGQMKHIQINIERQTGAIEVINKILTATDAG